MNPDDNPQRGDPARQLPAHSSALSHARQLFNWMLIPALLVLFIYLFIDHRAQSDYRIPSLDKAKITTGKLEVLDRRRHKGAFKITQGERSIIIGCIPNMDFLNCANPEIRTKYNGQKVVARYFVIENAKVYKNVLLQLEHDGQIILSYNDRIASLHHTQSNDSKFPLGYYVFAILIGLALNTVGKQKKPKQVQDCNS